MSEIGTALEDLFAVLESRRDELPGDSYTARLLTEPQDKLLAKIAEEAAEVIIASRDGDFEAIRYELADLVYHVLVVMVREGVSLDDLAGELASRRH